MSKKLQLAVVFGGQSSEHEVSLMSAASILENLDRDKYDIHQLGITKEGRWLLYGGPAEGLSDGRWLRESVPAFLAPDPTVHGIVALGGGGARVIPIDCVFPALHGKNGEDGTVQGLLELAGLAQSGGEDGGESPLALQARLKELSAEQAVLLDKVLADMKDKELNAQLKVVLDEKQDILERIAAQEQDEEQRAAQASRQREMEEWLDQQPLCFTEYDDTLTRRFVEQVTVVDAETIRVKIRDAGIEIERKLC